MAQGAFSHQWGKRNCWCWKEVGPMKSENWELLSWQRIMFIQHLPPTRLLCFSLWNTWCTAVMRTWRPRDGRLQVAIAILGFSLIQTWPWKGCLGQTSHSSNRLLSSFHTLCLTNGAIRFRGKKRDRNKRVGLSNDSSFLYPSEASCSSAFQRSVGLLSGVS